MPTHFGVSEHVVVVADIRCDIRDDESRFFPGFQCSHHHTAAGVAYISEAVSAAIRTHLPT